MEAARRFPIFPAGCGSNSRSYNTSTRSGCRTTAHLTGFEVAAMVNECQRVACGFGAPLVSQEQTVTRVRDGMEILGQLLAWAGENGGALGVL